MIPKLSRWLEDAFNSEHFTLRQIASMLMTLIMDSFCIMIINVLSSSMVSSVGEAAMAAVNMVGTVNVLQPYVYLAGYGRRHRGSAGKGQS